jgi:hypothetical protein
MKKSILIIAVICCLGFLFKIQFIDKDEKKDLIEQVIRNSDAVFDAYKVSVYEGELKEPNFNSNEAANQFMTRITEGCKDGINFAGYYTLVYWGCGTSCQYGVLVNRKTGEIIDGYQSSFGSEFKKDSKLIIFNSGLVDEDSKSISTDQFAKLEFKLLENNTFVNVEN